MTVLFATIFFYTYICMQFIKSNFFFFKNVRTYSLHPCQCQLRHFFLQVFEAHQLYLLFLLIFLLIKIIFTFFNFFLIKKKNFFLVTIFKIFSFKFFSKNVMNGRVQICAYKQAYLQNYTHTFQYTHIILYIHSSTRAHLLILSASPCQRLAHAHLTNEDKLLLYILLNVYCFFSFVLHACDLLKFNTSANSLLFVSFSHPFVDIVNFCVRFFYAKFCVIQYLAILQADFYYRRR